MSSNQDTETGSPTFGTNEERKNDQRNIQTIPISNNKSTTPTLNDQRDQREEDVGQTVNELNRDLEEKLGIVPHRSISDLHTDLKHKLDIADDLSILVDNNVEAGKSQRDIDNELNQNDPNRISGDVSGIENENMNQEGSTVGDLDRKLQEKMDKLEQSNLQDQSKSFLNPEEENLNKSVSDIEKEFKKKLNDAIGPETISDIDGPKNEDNVEESKKDNDKGLQSRDQNQDKTLGDREGQNISNLFDNIEKKINASSDSEKENIDSINKPSRNQQEEFKIDKENKEVEQEELGKNENDISSDKDVSELFKGVKNKINTSSIQSVTTEKENIDGTKDKKENTYPTVSELYGGIVGKIENLPDDSVSDISANDINKKDQSNVPFNQNKDGDQQEKDQKSKEGDDQVGSDKDKVQNENTVPEAEEVKNFEDDARTVSDKHKNIMKKLDYSDILSVETGGEDQENYPTISDLYQRINDKVEGGLDASDISGQDNRKKQEDKKNDDGKFGKQGTEDLEGSARKGKTGDQDKSPERKDKTDIEDIYSPIGYQDISVSELNTDIKNKLDFKTFSESSDISFDEAINPNDILAKKESDRAKIEELKRDIERIERHINEIRNEYIQTQNRLKAVIQQVKQAKPQEELKQEVEKLEKKLNQLKEEMVYLKKKGNQIEIYKQELNAQKQAIIKQLEETGSNASEIKQQGDVFEKVKQNFYKNLAVAKEKTRKLKEKEKKFEMMKHKLEDTINSLEASQDYILASKRKIDELEEKIKKNDNDFRDKCKEIDNNKKDHSAQKIKLEKLLESLKRDQEAWRRGKEVAEATLRDLENKQKKEEEDLRMHERDLDSKEQVLQSQVAELKVRQEEFDKKQTEANELKTIINKLKKNKEEELERIEQEEAKKEQVARLLEDLLLKKRDLDEKRREYQERPIEENPISQNIINNEKEPFDIKRFIIGVVLGMLSALLVKMFV